MGEGVMAQPNMPRTVGPADFAGGRWWVVPPGAGTPKLLVVGRLVAPVALGRGERVLLELPNLAGAEGEPQALAVFDGEQRFEVLGGYVRGEGA